MRCKLGYTNSVCSALHPPIGYAFLHRFVTIPKKRSSSICHSTNPQPSRSSVDSRSRIETRIKQESRIVWSSRTCHQPLFLSSPSLRLLHLHFCPLLFIIIVIWILVLLLLRFHTFRFFRPSHHLFSSSFYESFRWPLIIHFGVVCVWPDRITIATTSAFLAVHHHHFRHHLAPSFERSWSSCRQWLFS